jgi:ABC-2 type transport system permease protein
MKSAIWPMLWKEFIQMRRDKFTLAMMLGIPAIQLILFGYAIRMEVRHVPMVVMDQSQTQESRALVDVLRNTGNFDVVGTVTSREDIQHRIERGSAHAALIIPGDYTAALKRGRGAQAQLIIDAADPLSSTAAINAAALASSATALSLQEAAQGGNRIQPLDVRVRPWYNPDLDSSTFIVPGIIGVLLAMMLILITSMAIVREREHGTLEQLVVTPIGKTSIMLGKIIPFVVVGYVQMTVILVLGKLLFDIPIRGSIPLLYLLTFTYIVANLALGLLVSTLTRTQVQAMQLSFFFILPNILLSGFMFPRDAMPTIAQWIGDLVPLTYFLVILRGILLKGIGFSELWRQTLILGLFAVVLISLSVKRFTKTVG